MNQQNKYSMFIVILLLVGLFLPALSSDIAYGGVPPNERQLIGCCTTEDGGGQCLDCPEGATCVSTEDYCDSQQGFFSEGSCFNVPQGAQCGLAEESGGCCVIGPGSCVDVDSPDGCFLGEGPTGELFVFDQSCSEVPQCTITRNIPTMSNWGLIVLAGVFILAGIWAITRKRAEA